MRRRMDDQYLGFVNYTRVTFGGEEFLRANRLPRKARKYGLGHKDRQKQEAQDNECPRLPHCFLPLRADGRSVEAFSLCYLCDMKSATVLDDMNYELLS